MKIEPIYDRTMPSASEVLLPVIQGKLDGQLTALESARTRAAVALTASGVIATLFVTRFTDTTNVWEAIAMGIFVVGSIFSLAVLRSRKLILVPKGGEWIRFAKDSDTNYRTHVLAGGQGEDLSGLQLATVMVEDMQGWYAENEGTIGRAQKALTVSWITVIFQTIFWAVSIICK